MLFIASAALALAQAQFQSPLPKEYMPSAPAPNQVIATVNGIPLRGADVAPMVWQIYHGGIEQDYIDYLTIKSAADKAHVSVTDDEARAQLATFLDGFRSSLPPGETIQDALASQGFSDSRLLLRIRYQLLLDKIELLQFRPAEWVRVSALIYPTPGGKPEVVKASGASALADYDKLQKGASWDALLAHLTTKPDVIKNKGSIGWHSLSDFPKIVRDQILTLKVGQYTHPEQTPAGIEIFRLDELGGKAVGPDSQALRKAFLQANYKETRDRIKAETKIVRNDKP